MEMLPVISFEGDTVSVKGFCERAFVHNNSLTHVTSLVIPISDRDSGRILTMDKCEKYISNALALRTEIPVAQLSIDIFGGHLTYDDLTPEEKDASVITEEIMRRNAVNKLSAGLVRKTDSDTYEPVEIYPEKMKFVGIYNCSSPDNNEQGYVYSYEIEPRSDYTAMSKAYGKNGDMVRIPLTVSEFLLSELLNLNQMWKNSKSPGYKICDGLGRILDTGDRLYADVGIPKPRSDKNADKELRKFIIHVHTLVLAKGRDEQDRVVDYNTSFFGTKRQAEERGKELFKQYTGIAGNASSHNSSYWIEETE